MVKVYKNAKLRHGKGLCDIVVENGKYKKIEKNAGTGYPEELCVDLKGKLVSEPYVESHIHLDYVYTASIPKEETASGTLFEAIDKWSESKAVLTKDVIKNRAREAVKNQIKYGVQYIRTHVDVTDPNLTAFKAMLELKEELRDVATIQLIAFPQEGYYAFPGGDELVEEAVRMGADVVGGIPHFEFTREQGVESVKKAFELAEKYDTLVDIHCDETDDEQSRFVEVVASEAYFSGLYDRVTASHTCAMGSYNNAYAFKMMSKFQKAKLNFVSCPTENCYLQGRYDSYPKRRGLTRIGELVANGLNVSFAQDSISDPWYPLGNGNLMNQVDFGLHLGHMMSVEQISNGLDFITLNGAKTLHFGDAYRMKEGNAANFIVLEAENELDAIRNRAGILLHVREGKTIFEKAPEQILVSVL